VKWCCVVLRAGIRLVVMKQPRQGEWARYEAVSAVTRWGCAVDDATRDNTSTPPRQSRTRGRRLPRRFSSTGTGVLATKAKMRNRGMSRAEATAASEG